MAGKPVRPAGVLQHPFRPHNPTPYAPQLSKPTWDQLKPMITRLHLEGNSHPMIRQRLAQDHHVQISRGQLEPRLKQWGLTKDNKGLNTHPAETSQARDVTGPGVTQEAELYPENLRTASNFHSSEPDYTVAAYLEAQMDGKVHPDTEPLAMDGVLTAVQTLQPPKPTPAQTRGSHHDAAAAEAEEGETDHAWPDSQHARPPQTRVTRTTAQPDATLAPLARHSSPVAADILRLKLPPYLTSDTVQKVLFRYHEKKEPPMIQVQRLNDMALVLFALRRFSLAFDVFLEVFRLLNDAGVQSPDQHRQFAIAFVNCARSSVNDEQRDIVVAAASEAREWLSRRFPSQIAELELYVHFGKIDSQTQETIDTTAYWTANAVKPGLEGPLSMACLGTRLDISNAYGTEILDHQYRCEGMKQSILGSLSMIETYIQNNPTTVDVLLGKDWESFANDWGISGQRWTSKKGTAQALACFVLEYITKHQRFMQDARYPCGPCGHSSPALRCALVRTVVAVCFFLFEWTWKKDFDPELIVDSSRPVVVELTDMSLQPSGMLLQALRDVRQVVSGDLDDYKQLVKVLLTQLATPLKVSTLFNHIVRGERLVGTAAVLADILTEEESKELKGPALFAETGIASLICMSSRSAIEKPDFSPRINHVRTDASSVGPTLAESLRSSNSPSLRLIKEVALRARERFFMATQSSLATSLGRTSSNMEWQSNSSVANSSHHSLRQSVRSITSDLSMTGVST